jgi:hypothetical protein
MPETPKRIQLSRSKGWRMPDNTVKVDRSTGFGNPFPISKGTATSCGVTTPIWTVGTWDGPAMWMADSPDDARRMSVDAFRAWINAPDQAHLIERARTELRGKSLACWCQTGSLCHADVLLEIANSPSCEEAA